jgi:hypothetical protein
METFYLLAAARRLERLERLYESYQAAPDAPRRKTAADQVIGEIRRLRRSHSDLRAAAEKPVPVGGRLRGTDSLKGATREDLAALAVEISGGEFFCKTVTIEHR